MSTSPTAAVVRLPAAATAPSSTPSTEPSSAAPSPDHGYAGASRARTPPRTDPPARRLHAVTSPPPDDAPGRVAARRPLDDVAHEEPKPPADPTTLCCSIVQAVVETLRGVRPLAQLNRWLSPEVYEVVARRREITLAGATHSSRPARVRRARVVRVGPTAAEATVIVDDVTRVRAAAVRVEHARGSWRVVALELG